MGVYAGSRSKGLSAQYSEPLGKKGRERRKERTDKLRHPLAEVREQILQDSIA